MRWLGCCVLGLVVGFALGRLMPSNDAPSDVGVADGTGRSDEPTGTDRPPMLEVRAAPDATSAPVPGAKPGPEGEGLGVGQGLVLATGAVVTGSDLSRADLVIHDIRERAAWLATPHGAAGGALPLGALGGPRTARDLAATFEDAPLELPDRARVLEVGPVATGVAFVRDDAGTVYLVWLDGLVLHDDVLRRRVRLAHRVVPARAKGGVARMATAVAGEVEVATTRTLEAIARRADGVPRGMNRTVRRLAEAPKLVEDLEDGATLKGHRPPLVLPEAVGGRLKVGASTLVVATRGDTPDARIETGFHGVLVLFGDLRGDHVLEGHAHVHVTGDVLGNVRMKNHATLVVDGDLRGSVTQGSWTRLILHGGL